MVRPEQARPGRPRRGSILVEFAMIALVMYLILAAILEFGFALFGALVLQQAVDVAAREIARTPGLPATGALGDVLYADAAAHPEYQDVRASLFDEKYLKIPYQDIARAVGDRPLVAYFDDKPLLNRLLFPLMVVAHDEAGAPAYLEYPGIVPVDPPGPDGNRFQIPVAGSGRRRAESPDGGAEAAAFAPVVEEIDAVPGDPSTSSFNLASKVPLASNRGVVALRINYPFRAAAVGAPAAHPAAPDRGPRPAGDSAPGGMDAGDPPGRDVIATGTGGPGTGIRPARRLISVQAIYRRELY